MQAEPLHSGGRVWATAQVIIGDSEVFEFPVGCLMLGNKPLTAQEQAEAAESLSRWAAKTKASIISASVPAPALTWGEALAKLDFACIDFTLQMTLMSTKKRPRPALTGKVRLATPADHARIEAIAGTAFDFGRYHRDRRFPRALADKRFAAFVRKAMNQPGPGEKFFVLGPEGEPGAFMFVTAQDGRAQWWLGGVARDTANGLLGPMLFAGVLDALEAEAVRSVTAKISAANTGVLNIYSHLGFQASAPEFTFHWRNPDSRYLLQADAAAM